LEINNETKIMKKPIQELKAENDELKMSIEILENK